MGVVSDSMIGEDGGRAPDLIVPVVGFRRWKLIDGRLHSPFIQQCVWDEPDMEAGCFTHGGDAKGKHSAPHESCHCGLYMYYERHAVSSHEVVGAVTVTGRMQVHDDGIRAQRLKIVALGLVKPHFMETEESMGRAKEANDALRSMAKQWNVPLVPDEQLDALVLEHGEPLPEDILEQVREKNLLKRQERARRAAEVRERRAKERAETEGRLPLPSTWFEFVRGIFS